MKRITLLMIICFGGSTIKAQQQNNLASKSIVGTVQEQATKTPITYAKVASPITNLGVIILQPDAKLLNEVTVSGEQPSISLRLDKKVFQVGKDVLSQTGSSLDILNGVPSVSVSPTGAVSLRGNSNVLILIDGRRSGFTQGNALDQLPADQIEKIEVITNPSSRYDAAGSAGIINIILKKNKKSGLNGQLSLVGGVPNETRITPSLNYKSAKINLFSTFGLRYSDYDGLNTSNQTTNDAGITNMLSKRQVEDRHDDAKMLYFGGDFLINNHNTITAALICNTTFGIAIKIGIYLLKEHYQQLQYFRE